MIDPVNSAKKEENDIRSYLRQRGILDLQNKAGYVPKVTNDNLPPTLVHRENDFNIQYRYEVRSMKGFTHLERWLWQLGMRGGFDVLAPFWSWYWRHKTNRIQEIFDNPPTLMEKMFSLDFHYACLKNAADGWFGRYIAEFAMQRKLLYHYDVMKQRFLTKKEIEKGQK